MRNWEYHKFLTLLWSAIAKRAAAEQYTRQVGAIRWTLSTAYKRMYLAEHIYFIPYHIHIDL